MKPSNTAMYVRLETDLISVHRSEWIMEANGKRWSPVYLKVIYRADGSVYWTTKARFIRSDGTPGYNRREFDQNEVPDGAAKEALLALVKELRPEGYGSDLLGP